MRKMGIGLGVGINRSNYAQGIFGAYATRVVADGGVVEGGACVDAVSSLLQSASLLLIPSGYKANKLYSEIPTNGNGDLTWTRASTAIRTNSSGLLESMATGVPRLSYMYGSCPSVLLEPQRTNLALQSQDFDNASWIKVGLSVSANTTTSPDGTNNADTITSTGTSQAIIVQTPTIVSGSTYSLSFYVKQNTQRYVYIRFTSNSSSENFVSVVYDLQDGTVGQSAVGTTSGTLVATKVELAANGFYRISLIASINTTVANIGVGFATAKTGNTFNNFGLITSAITSGNSFSVYGAQIEAGAYPTTYIPTTSATATRVADSFSRNNIYTNGLISASGGTWFVEFRGNVSYVRDTGSIGIELRDSTGNRVYINTYGGGQRNSVSINLGGTITELYRTLTDTVKMAIKWNGSTIDLFVNGTKVSSATSFTSTQLETMNASSTDVPRFIQQMALFPSALTDAQCQTLTT